MTGISGLGWTEQAACVSVPELPWIGPRRGQLLDPGELGQMIDTCDRCPVLQQCRHYVDQGEVSAGFWAGQWQHPNPDTQVIDGSGSHTDGCAGGRVA